MLGFSAEFHCAGIVGSSSSPGDLFTIITSLAFNIKSDGEFLLSGTVSVRNEIDLITFISSRCSIEILSSEFTLMEDVLAGEVTRVGSGSLSGTEASIRRSRLLPFLGGFTVICASSASLNSLIVSSIKLVSTTAESTLENLSLIRVVEMHRFG
jgi:hypothetical protein